MSFSLTPEDPLGGHASAYAFGPFLLRPDERRLLRNGVTVAASPKVIETLLVLAERSGEVVTKDELMERVWPGVFVEEGNLTQNISNLRRIFRDDFPGPGIILTLSKRGYSLVAEVERRHPAAAHAVPVISPPSGLDATVEEWTHLPPEPTKDAGNRRERSHLLQWRFVVGLLLVISLAVFLVLRLRTSNDVHASRPSVAILGFENLSNRPDVAWLSGALTENLQVDLSASENLRLIPGEVVSRAERELALPPTASLSEASLTRVHRDIDCDVVVVGSYLVAGARIRLNVSVEDAVTGKILGTYSHTEDQDQVLPLIADTGVKLRQMLHVQELSRESADQVNSARETNPDALKLYDEGLEKIRFKDGEGARELLEQAIDLNPKSPMAHLALSQAWSLAGYDAKANGEAKKAVEFSGPLSRENQLRIQARLYETEPNWSKAVESYRALQLFFPDDPEYGFLLANAQISAGQPNDALNEMRTMHDHGPKLGEDDPRELLLETSALAAESRWPEALSAAQQGAALAQTQGSLIIYERALRDEAEYLGKLGQPQQEDDTIRQAVDIANKVGDRFGSMTLLLLRAGALRRARNLTEAYAAIQQALALSESIGARQKTVECLITLAAIDRDGNDLSGAKQVLERGLALAQELGSAKTALVKLNLANVENNLGEPEQARALYVDALKSAEAVEDRGTQNILHGNLGILDAAEGRLDEALAMLQLAIAGNQAIAQNASIAYDLGQIEDILLMKGDFGGAHRTLDEQAKLLSALGRGRGLEEQQFSRAQLALEEGKLDEAQPTLTAALSSCKDVGLCSSVNRLLALLWLKRGDAKQARTYADKSYELAHTLENPGDYIIPANLQLGEVDAALGRPLPARELFTLAEKQAHQLKLLPLELQARSDLAEMQLASAPAQARSALAEVQREAVSHQLALVASHAKDLMTRGN